MKKEEYHAAERHHGVTVHVHVDLQISSPLHQLCSAILQVKFRSTACPEGQIANQPPRRVVPTSCFCDVRPDGDALHQSPLAQPARLLSHPVNLQQP